MGAEKWGCSLREICDQDMVFMKEGHYCAKCAAREKLLTEEGDNHRRAIIEKEREAQSTGRGKAGCVGTDSGRLVVLVMA